MSKPRSRPESAKQRRAPRPPLHDTNTFTPERTHPLESLQHTAGNRAVAVMMDRRTPVDVAMLTSGGVPMDAGLRALMEARFADDFGMVRLHSGPDAELTAQRFGAKAFAFGEHIWLGRGAAPSNQRLLSHELAHVLQQRGGPITSARPAISADAGLESAAQRASGQVSAGGVATPVQGGAAAAVQRIPEDPAFLDQPRSRYESVDGYAISLLKLEEEIHAIRKWLSEGHTDDRERMKEVLLELEAVWDERRRENYVEIAPADATPTAIRQPLSLHEPLVPKKLNDDALEEEIDAIHIWLEQNRGSSDADRLELARLKLEEEWAIRTGEYVKWREVASYAARAELTSGLNELRAGGEPVGEMAGIERVLEEELASRDASRTGGGKALPPVTRIQDLFDRMEAAQRLDLMDPPDRARAITILESVNDWMGKHVVTGKVTDAMRGHGLNLTFADTLAWNAYSKVSSMLTRMQMNERHASTKPGSLNLWTIALGSMKAAREYFEIYAGELSYNQAPYAQAVEETQWMKLAVPATIAVVAFGGLAVATMVAEGTLIATLTAAGQSIYIFTVTNPELALVLAELAVGTVMEIEAAGGLGAFLEGLATPQGALATVYNIMTIWVATATGTRPARIKTVSGNKIRVELEAGPPAGAAPAAKPTAAAPQPMATPAPKTPAVAAPSTADTPAAPTAMGAAPEPTPAGPTPTAPAPSSAPAAAAPSGDKVMTTPTGQKVIRRPAGSFGKKKAAPAKPTEPEEPEHVGSTDDDIADVIAEEIGQKEAQIKRTPEDDADEVRDTPDVKVLTSTTPADRLRAALEADGIPVPEGHDPHHIVPEAGGGWYGDQCRQILDEARVGIDSANNGVPLLRTSLDPKVVTDAATTHWSVHTPTYFRTLYERLRGQPPELVPDIMKGVRNEINDGTFPHLEFNKPPKPLPPLVPPSSAAPAATTPAAPAAPAAKPAAKKAPPPRGGRKTPKAPPKPSPTPAPDTTPAPAPDTTPTPAPAKTPRTRKSPSKEKASTPTAPSEVGASVASPITAEVASTASAAVGKPKRPKKESTSGTKSPKKKGSDAKPKKKASDAKPKKKGRPFPDILERGQTVTMPDGAVARRLPDGAVAIESRIGPSTGRKGYEDLLPPSVEVDRPKWERAHSQGQGTGHESPYGIYYAPREVNQELQRCGIEQSIRDLRDQAAPDVTFFLRTATSAHEGTRALKNIIYQVRAERNGDSRIVFEIEIWVSKDVQNPRTGISGDPYDWSNIEDWLK